MSKCFLRALTKLVYKVIKYTTFTRQCWVFWQPSDWWEHVMKLGAYLRTILLTWMCQKDFHLKCVWTIGPSWIRQSTVIQGFTRLPESECTRSLFAWSLSDIRLCALNFPITLRLLEIYLFTLPPLIYLSQSFHIFLLLNDVQGMTVLERREPFGQRPLFWILWTYFGYRVVWLPRFLPCWCSMLVWQGKGWWCYLVKSEPQVVHLLVLNAVMGVMRVMRVTLGSTCSIFLSVNFFLPNPGGRAIRRNQ